MIDWISVRFQLRHRSIKAGHFLLFDEEGQVLSDKPIAKIFKGSYESKISLRSQGTVDGAGYSSELFLSGNPSKFLQGHNVFGILDLNGLLFGVLSRLHDVCDLGIEPVQIVAAINSGVVTRIDITHSIQFANRLQVRSYIKQVSQLAHTRSGRAMQKKWTLAFQATSRRWSVVVYSKGDEVDTHKVHPDFKEKQFIQDEANRLVRVELRLRSLELITLDCRKVHQLSESKLTSLYTEYIGRIKMSNSVELSSDQIASLSRTLKATYFLWKEGVDIQSEMSESTYYLHVKKIKEIGVDISVPYQESEVSNVVPIKTVLQGSAYETPQEAFQKGLVFQPRALRLV